MTAIDGVEAPDEGRPGNAGLPPSRALVTGVAGFVGSHLAERLLRAGHEVVGVDCFTDFYPRAAKERNLAGLRAAPRFAFVECDLSRDPLDGLMAGVGTVFHLAAQAGVRTSFGEQFPAYARHNIHATQRLLEAAVRSPPAAFVYASSSSVYGNPLRTPTPEETERRPRSPYGMTKVATEELAAVYHRAAGVPVVGLRYFTIYGPRQRPDMAFSRFIGQALAGGPVAIFGDGRQLRDFTYVGDAVEATLAAAEHGVPGSVYNVGAGMPVPLIHVVDLLEELLDEPVALEYAAAAMGDVLHTCAEGRRARDELGFSARVSLREGLGAQLEWMSAGAAAAPPVPTRR
jgi:nucleoside-diphosphate-sugar epimerase